METETRTPKDGSSQQPDPRRRDVVQMKDVRDKNPVTTPNLLYD